MAQAQAPIYLANIPGMGVGYRANMFLPRGTLVLQEAPAVLLPRVNMAQPERDSFIQAGVARMQQHHPHQFQQFQQLHIAHQFTGLPATIGRFLTNALPCEEDMRRPGLFLEAARFNASCKPNVHQYWNGALLQFRTMTDIHPQQELFISNNTRELLLPTSDRRARILQNVGYQCQCVACLQTGAPRMESDTRRHRISQALAVGNWTDITRVVGNINTIRAALQDLRHEGMYHFRDTLLYDGYQVCRTAGDGNNAMLWLDAAYQAAVAVVGDQNPQVQAMRHLLHTTTPQNLYFQGWTPLGPPPPL